MRKLMKFVCGALVLVCLWTLGVTLWNKHTLSRGLIRLHVVADSDSESDQALKLRVRDAVLQEVDRIGSLETVTDAREFLQAHLEELQAAADRVLEAAGSSDRAEVTLCREEFPVREYDTFTLPSGIYESLRVTIGSGEGKNWWCVVFPTLCVGAASEDFRDSAASAGFSESLTNTLSDEEGYEISFFLLDCLGKLENFFHFR